MRFVWIIVLALTGCIKDSLVPCGDLECPRGTTCVSGACATTADFEACQDKTEGEACSSETNAFCHAGACRASECGDSFMSPDEACDDGNRTSGDGCSDDCRSDETCGNGIVDYVVGEQCDEGVRGLSGDGCTSLCRVEYDTWRNVTPQPLGVRYGHAMAYDPVRARTVVFSGSSQLGVVGETWEFDGGNWLQRITALAPSGRTGYAMATAPTGGVVMFGGLTSLGRTDETWTWDGTIWRQRASGVVPPPREQTAMAFDSTRNRVVLFGGAGASGPLGDTWSWDGSTWTKLTPTASPPARSAHAMAYDPVRDRVVLFGGGNGPGSDTWEFDGTTWVQRMPPSPPQARSGHVMVYSVARGKIVMFGGIAGPLGSLADTWEWNGAGATGSWTSISDPTSPGQRMNMAAAYDVARARIVMHGGLNQGPFGVGAYYSDTWEYTGQWNPATVNSGSPSLRAKSAFAFDALRGRGVLFGGVFETQDQIIGLGDTWEWDGAAWSERPTSGGPVDYEPTGAVFDGARGVVMLLTSNGETWTWNGIIWVKKTPALAPPSTFGGSLAYDSARERVVLFGGTGTAATWEWDGTTWANRTPAISPPQRQRPGLAYDAKRGVVVMFGGEMKLDTWEWDGTSWTDRTPAIAPTSPPSRTSFVMVYEGTRQRVLLFGGQLGSMLFDDTWEWDGTRWSARSPVLSPPRRAYAAATYDAFHGEIVMFAGKQVEDVDDTWTYRFLQANAPRDQCEDAMADTDHDGLKGCADPDCWGRCTPLCPPGASCASATPRCGDGMCSGVEDYLLCPADCP